MTEDVILKKIKRNSQEQEVEKEMLSPIWIFLIVLSLIILRSLARYFLVDQRKLKIYRKRIQKWKEQREKAKKEQDPKLLRKVQSKESKIQRFQAQIGKERMKPMCLFMIPFLVVFYLIRIFFSTPIPVGLSLPKNLLTQWFFHTPKEGLIGPVWFYVLCNLSLNSLVTATFRLFGLLEKGPGMGMGMGMGRR